MTVERFLVEYPRALARLENEYGNMHATGVEIRPWYEVRVQHFVLAGSFQTRTVYPAIRKGRLENYPHSYIRSERPGLIFKIGQNQADAPYYIAGIGKGVEGDVERYNRRYSKPLSLAMTHAFDFSMREMISDSNISIDAIQGDLEGFVEVTFNLRSKGGYFQSAIFRLVPSQGWVIDSYELIHEPQSPTDVASRFLGQITYDIDNLSGKRVPKHVTVTLDESPNGQQSLIEWKLEDVEFGTVTPDLFELPHFGLNTRGAIQEFRIPPWLLWANAIALSLVLSYVLFNIIKRINA